MFGLFKKSFLKESFLGVDIGTSSIKIAEVAFGKDGPEFLNYGILEELGNIDRPNTALQSSTLKLFDQDVISYIKFLSQKSHFKSTGVVASLPAFSVFTTVVELPVMVDSELADALKFKAKQYIPLPISSITIDWIKVKEKEDADGNKKQLIFLIAITNEQVEKYKKIFSAAGLKLIALEIEGFSLARSLAKEDKPTVIVDIGARSTGISVAQDGVLYFSSQSDFAGSTLTRAVASGLGVNNRRAEDLKKQRGLLNVGIGAEQELSTLMKPTLDVIINEVKRVMENYRNTYHQEVKEVVLTGGGAQLLGLEDYFTKELSLPVKKANPFAGRLPIPVIKSQRFPNISSPSPITV